MHPRLVALLLLGLSSHLTALQRTPEEIQKHLGDLIQLAANADTLSKEDKIRRLGGALRQLSQPSIFPEQETARPIYLEAQRILLETPGHAHYYRDRILEAKNKAFTNGQPAKFPEYHDYTIERMYAFQTLAHLPSLETLEVLNGFLDDKDRPGDWTKNPGYYTPLNQIVIPTFNNLIEEQAKRDYGITWFQWRDAVRAGELTFRFKGSDVRYNFEGPMEPRQERAHKSRPPDGISPSPSQKPGTLGASADQNDPRSPWPIFVAVACLIGALVYLALSRRQKASGGE